MKPSKKSISFFQIIKNRLGSKLEGNVEGKILASHPPTAETSTSLWNKTAISLRKKELLKTHCFYKCNLHAKIDFLENYLYIQ